MLSPTVEISSFQPAARASLAAASTARFAPGESSVATRMRFIARHHPAMIGRP
jgi:hypothetical protein